MFDSFFVKIPLTNEQIHFEYFVPPSVGQATKGINVKNIDKYRGLIF